MPGTIDTLPADIRHYNSLETFPVISYQMNSRDGKKTEAELFPLADPGRKYGLHCLGLVNTLSLPVATDEPAITIDPGQLLKCIRYCPRELQGGLKPNRLTREPVTDILPQTVCNKSIVKTPTTARYNTYSL